MEKIESLTSQDIVQQNLETLKQLFPTIVKEGKLNVEELQALLGEYIDDEDEFYRFTWAGKNLARQEANKPSTATLRPNKVDSKDWDSTGNIFIEGDNLEVLKLLQKSYSNKIKMIYIDPPYNTGKDFVYKDNYKDNLSNYLELTGQKDSAGNKTSTNTESDGRYHSNWLNMMYPRLQLARNLLTEDGVIFISIDDNEQANLKKLCDEIFGEENFVIPFIWKSRQNKDNRSITGVSNDHEYILCYTKITQEKILRGDNRKVEQYKNPDNDPRGNWVSGNMVGLLPENLRPNCHYNLINPKTGIEYIKPQLGWRYDKNTMNRLIEEDRIIWPEESSGRPRKKAFLNELSNEFTGISSLFGEGIYTRDGTKEIDSLFKYKAFDFPKPSKLLKKLLTQASLSSDTILDFFAGSGTTAHAIMKLNAEDGGYRKYISVQLPEPTDEKSEAFQTNYTNIAEITKERIRRA